MNKYNYTNKYHLQTTTQIPNRAGECYNFVTGDPVGHTFTSPNYPRLYPPSIDCIRVISAPDNYTVQLSFADLLFEVCFTIYVLYTLFVARSNHHMMHRQNLVVHIIRARLKMN
jgi:hypothetical protein